MEHFGRFQILEQLAQGRIRSYRAWDPASKQIGILHLGWLAESEIPAFSDGAVREKGHVDDQLFLFTPDLSQFHDLNSAVNQSALSADSGGNTGGEFTRMFQQWKEPAPPAQLPDPQPTSRANSGSASDSRGRPPVPQIEKQIIRVGPSRAKASDQISNPALSLPNATFAKSSSPEKPQVAEPGEFTKLFQNPDALLASGAKPVQTPEKPGESTAPEPGTPGEFTRIFRQPGSPVPLQKEQPAAAPDKKDKKENEFENVYHSSLPEGDREIDFAAIERSAPPKSAPAPKPVGEFTEMFGRRLSNTPEPIPSASRGAIQNGNATVLFEPAASPPPKPAPGQPGEFTQSFAGPSRLNAQGDPAGAAPAGAPEGPAKSSIGAIILIGAALIVIVILMVLFLLLRS